MAIKKAIEKAIVEKVKVSSSCNEELKTLLRKEMPALFDRTPEITGDLNPLVEKICKICK